jgi:molybdate transport system substrate-binding protein
MSDRIIATLLAVAAMTVPAMAAEPVLLHSAGSLRSALTETAAAFEAATGVKVQAKFGPSGSLKDEIAGGARAEVFTSANMEHPQALEKQKRSGPVVLFARNRLCALVRPGLAVDSATVLDRMLDSNVKLGTSTPRADPAGDYAWDVFQKAEMLKPGAFAALEHKALQLVGGPSAPTAPPGRTVYGLLMADGKADIFLTYCTNAMEATKENPGLQTVRLPAELAVAADYGMTVITGASANAYQFAMFILSADGQRALAKYGFTAPNLPQ